MIDAGKRSFTLRFDDTIRELYPAEEAVAIRMIDELPGPDLGLRIALASNRPDFSHFLLAEAGGDFKPLSDGVLTLKLDADAAAEPRRLRVKAAMTDGTESEPHELTVSFSPRGGDRQETANNMARLTARPFLHRAATALEDWKFPVPTDDEIEYAHRKWGPLLEGVEGDYARAKTLAKALLPGLWANKDGTPTGLKKGKPPFEQYELMAACKDTGHCVQFSQIFECACKCFGLIARRVGMAEVPWVSHRLFLHTSPNHSTNEIFDRQANQWVLVDLRYHMLGAFLGEEGPLSIAEFYLMLNQPRRRERLRLLVRDPDTGDERLLPLAECPRPDMNCYEGWTRFFTFSKI